MALIKETKGKTCCWGRRKDGPLDPAGGNITWSHHSGNQGGQPPKDENQNWHQCPDLPTPHLQVHPCAHHRGTCPSTFLPYYWQEPRKEPVWMSRDRWVDREKVGHMHKGTVFSCKERWNCNSFRKLDETTGHPVKWNKPDSQVNIACFLFHAESRFKYRSVCMCVGVYICICVWGRGESTPPQCYLNSQALWLSHHGFSVTPLLTSSLLYTLALYVVIHSAAPPGLHPPHADRELFSSLTWNNQSWRCGMVPREQKHVLLSLNPPLQLGKSGCYEGAQLKHLQQPAEGHALAENPARIKKRETGCLTVKALRTDIWTISLLHPRTPPGKPYTATGWPMGFTLTYPQ